MVRRGREREGGDEVSWRREEVSSSRQDGVGGVCGLLRLEQESSRPVPGGPGHKREVEGDSSS
eukprot:207464-Hanusia_phi.AAC.2